MNRPFIAANTKNDGIYCTKHKLSAISYQSSAISHYFQTADRNKLTTDDWKLYRKYVHCGHVARAGALGQSNLGIRYLPRTGLSP